MTLEYLGLVEKKHIKKKKSKFSTIYENQINWKGK